ncbi:MAG: PAS domain-containing protein [Bacteroidetes bacterium]|nr:PAS domain-containing protein [Bacteroidota bacterium]
MLKKLEITTICLVICLLLFGCVGSGEDLSTGPTNSGEWNIPENKTFWSDEVFRIFGFAPQQFEVTYESFLDRIHPNDRSFVEEAVNRVLADPETGYNIQHRIIRPDGTERIVHERGEVKLGEDGKPARMTGTMQDLTEFKNIEAETSQLRDELAHLNRLGIIGNMASAIAHEINQPLAAILSNSQAALRLLNINPPDLNEVREALTDIADADKRAGEVIRRIRTMVKKEGFHRELYNINTLIGEVIDLVQSEVVIQNISLTTNLEPRVPGIYGDKIQMQQVILNLIMNALDAVKNQPIDARHIVITTSVEDKEGLEVRVTDSGPGVEEDNIENIFDAFYTTKTQGMGLGLSVCHSIIENHGGRIWVENCSGGGAKFSFRLPFRMDDDL